MKLIQSSIDAENLQNSISHADLEKEMASCDVAQVNGQQAKESICVEKAGAENASKVNKLTNGISGKIESPTKCNGDMNYYDDISDDDYQLVLEASSDEGGSPVKKIDDDAISAPQIVQEIEDLLGINSNSTGIDEELEKELVNLDGSESIDLNEKDEDTLINGDIANKIPQEIQDIFGEQEVTNNGLHKEVSQKENKIEGHTVGITKPTETTECDSSSNMNLVFDEVEIGTDNMETQDLAVSMDRKNVEELVKDSHEESAVTLPTTNHLSTDEDDYKVKSITEKNIANHSVNNDGKSEKPKEDKKWTTVTEIKSDGSESDIPLSQNSHLSDSSVEWTVLDSIETSEDEGKAGKETERDSSEVSQSATKELINLEKGTTEDELVDNNGHQGKDIEIDKRPENVVVDTISQPGEDVEVDNNDQRAEDVEVDKSQPSEDVVVGNNYQRAEDIEVDKIQPTEKVEVDNNDQQVEEVEVDNNDKQVEEVEVDNNVQQVKVVKVDKIQPIEDVLVSTISQKMEDVDTKIQPTEDVVVDTKSQLTEGMIVSTISSAEEDITEPENKLLISDDKAKTQDIDAALDNQDVKDTISSAAGTITEGEGPRKRTASLCEEETEYKRAKVEKGEKHSVENTQCFKRPCSDPQESDTKRTKFNVSPIAEELNSINVKPSVEAVSKPCETNTEENIKTEESVKIVDAERNIDLNCDKSVKIGCDENKFTREKELAHMKAECSQDTVINNKSSKCDVSLVESSVASSESKTSLIEQSVKNKIITVEATSESSQSNKRSVTSNSRFEVALETPSQSLASEVKRGEISNEKSEGPSCDVIDVDLQNEEGSLMEIDDVSKTKDDKVSSSSTENSNDAGFKLDAMCENNSTERKESTPSKEGAKAKPYEEAYPTVKEILKTVQLFNVATAIQTDSEKSKLDQKAVNKPTTTKSDQITDVPGKTKKCHFDLKPTTKSDQITDVAPKAKKHHFDNLSKNMMSKKTEFKGVSNLDTCIDTVAKTGRTSCIDPVTKNGKTVPTRALPLLKKFHKDQLRKLSRSELEETVVLKICEAITDRSEIGQMRLRCQNLEQSNELWRKKAVQFEKQNRELEMVLKRFLAETSQIKRDSPNNRMALPIKVTRSVGLQVVLASSMHGALVSRHRMMNPEPQQTETSRVSVVEAKLIPIKPKAAEKEPVKPKPVEKESLKPKPVEKEPLKPKPVEKEPLKPKPVEKDPVKPKPVENQSTSKVKGTTFIPPVQTSISGPAQPTARGRGRPPKHGVTPTSSSPQPSPAKVNKVTPPSTPAKPAPPKTIPTPTKDLEVIDLTEKEEKTKATPMQNPVGGAIRVSPSTQVCFVQQSPTSSATAQMAYIVQKQGQRQQYLVTTASPSPPRPPTVSRPPPALSLPVLQTNRQILPYPNTPQVAVRSASHPVTTNQRQVSQQIHQFNKSPVPVLKHPAPLPVGPSPAMKPGVKLPPPKPQLKIAKTVNGIMLSWSMTLNDDIADMASYQLYAYQEGNQAPTMNLWKKVGDVKALPLPMACTLTQFVDGHKYHFAVRAVDVLGRIGPFSPPSTITLNK